MSEERPDGTETLRRWRERLEAGPSGAPMRSENDGTAQLRRWRIVQELELRFRLASRAERYRPAPPRAHGDDMRPLSAVIGGRR